MSAPWAAGRQHVAQRLRDVWAWNFNAELDELLAVIAHEPCAVIAFDTEFPGFLCEDSVHSMLEVRYMALQQNVNHLQPIQLGLAAAGTNGVLQGAWNFNLWFDLSNSLYTEESVRFLSAAGIDFPRHAVEGIDPTFLAWRLLDCQLVGFHSKSPRWVTFSGWYDWGYLMKVLTGCVMPVTFAEFENNLAIYFPHRCELRDSLPRGSLDSLLTAYGIQRVGYAHTAGSDALATLELFLRVELWNMCMGGAYGMDGGAAWQVQYAGVNGGGKDAVAAPTPASTRLEPKRQVAISVAQNKASQIVAEKADVGDAGGGAGERGRPLHPAGATPPSARGLDLDAARPGPAKPEPPATPPPSRWPLLGGASLFRSCCPARCRSLGSSLLSRLSDAYVHVMAPSAGRSCKSVAVHLPRLSGIVGKLSAVMGAVDGQRTTFSLQAFCTICVFVLSCCYLQL